MVKKSDPLKIATVFSGIGAPEYALKKLSVDHQVTFACDNGEIEILGDDKEIKEQLGRINDPKKRKIYVDSLVPAKRTNFVKQSYLANHKVDESHFHHDVRFIDGNQYHGEVDIFIGGSPCQSFTLFGYQKGLEEARGTLFYDFARLIQEIRPKAFVYENVQGMVRHDKGKTWKVVKKVFEQLGYKVFDAILDAADFGIPQKRRRLFIVGFADHSVEFQFPKKSVLKYTLQDFLEENLPVGNFRYKGNGLSLKKGRGKVEDRYFLSERVLPGIMSSGTGGFHMPPEIDLKIARPLMSSMHKLHRAGVDNYVTTNDRIRRLTPRECLRLMGYSDGFKQVVSNTQMYRQAGNSMVVDVMAALIKNIIRYL